MIGQSNASRVKEQIVRQQDLHGTVIKMALY